MFDHTYEFQSYNNNYFYVNWSEKYWVEEGWVVSNLIFTSKGDNAQTDEWTHIRLIMVGMFPWKCFKKFLRYVCICNIIYGWNMVSGVHNP